METSKESYAATIIYENAEAKTVGQIPVKGPTMAAVNMTITQINGAKDTVVSEFRDSSEDTFSRIIE